MITSKHKRAYTKKWRENNPEKKRENDKNWRANNPDYAREWRVNNREKIREYDRGWAANHPEKMREKCRKRTANYSEKQQKEAKARATKNHFGSLERYEEAFFKYDGWCAFACDDKAELVHHLDGKSVNNSPREEVDNSLQNLLPLCRSCHMRLHHPKGIARGII